MNKRQSIVLLHNIVTPARLPLFNELAKYYDLDVIFCERTSPNRQWSSSTEGADFGVIFLASKRLGKVALNWGLRRQLKGKRYAAYLLADNEQNIFTIINFVIIAKLRKNPIIVWNEHVERKPDFCQTFSRTVLNSLLNFYRRWLYRQASAFLSMSGAATDKYLEKFGALPNRIFTNTQVMPQSLLPNPGKRSTGSYPYLLYIGYFRPEKNISQLVKAFRSAHSHGFHLLIAGTGPEETKLKQLAAPNKNIHFQAYTDGAAKAALFSNAAVFVLPSLYEPWGLVVNESLYYKTPVICSDAVAASCLIQDGKNGLIVKTASQQSLEACLDNFMTDKTLQKQLNSGVARMEPRILCSPAYGIEHFVKAINYCLKQQA